MCDDAGMLGSHGPLSSSKQQTAMMLMEIQNGSEGLSDSYLMCSFCWCVLVSTEVVWCQPSPANNRCQPANRTREREKWTQWFRKFLGAMDHPRWFWTWTRPDWSPEISWPYAFCEKQFRKTLLWPEVLGTFSLAWGRLLSSLYFMEIFIHDFAGRSAFFPLTLALTRNETSWNLKTPCKLRPHAHHEAASQASPRQMAVQPVPWKHCAFSAGWDVSCSRTSQKKELAATCLRFSQVISCWILNVDFKCGVVHHLHTHSCIQPPSTLTNLSLRCCTIGYAKRPKGRTVDQQGERWVHIRSHSHTLIHPDMLIDMNS